MVKLLSTIHHGLRLPGLGIKFRDGEADVAEDLVPDALRFAYLGVALAEGEPVKVSDPDENEDDPDGDFDDDQSDEDKDIDDSDEDIDDESDEDEDLDQSDEDEDGGAADVADEQPRGNASRDAWAAYAERLGVPVAEGATRDEIRALFE